MPRMSSLRPHISWRTTTPGCGPPVSGAATKPRRDVPSGSGMRTSSVVGTPETLAGRADREPVLEPVEVDGRVPQDGVEVCTAEPVLDRLGEEGRHRVGVQRVWVGEVAGPDHVVGADLS